MKRIETFLNEPEVSQRVSSMKRDNTPLNPTAPEDTQLGIINASFKWNEIEKEDGLNVATNGHGSESESTMEPGDSVSVTSNGAEERKFELREINVIFPEGKFMVVTGPSMYSILIHLERVR